MLQSRYDNDINMQVATRLMHAISWIQRLLARGLKLTVSIFGDSSRCTAVVCYENELLLIVALRVYIFAFAGWLGSMLNVKLLTSWWLFIGIVVQWCRPVVLYSLLILHRVPGSLMDAEVQ